MYDFKNRVVVITGATSGIGAATAELFAEYGAKVLLIGRNASRGVEIVKKIQSENGVAEFYACDVTDTDDVKKVSGAIIAKEKKVDVLFNNAGVMLASSEIERMSIENWNQTFATNINGMFYITRELKPYMVACKGNIINNASIAGLQHYAAGRSYAYSASKAAVIQFSHQMAKNYGEEGVRVNCICPGIIDTPILGDRDRKVYAERIPLGYVAQPVEVAKVVIFLASEQAGYLTGVVLPVDGGVSL